MKSGELFMKLDKDFVTHMMGDEQVMVGVGNADFKGIVKSNKTAAFIIDKLKEETTKEEILKAMLEKYDVTEAVASADIDKIIVKLRSIGAIKD